MGNEAAQSESVSQQIPGIIDTGEESFSVDYIPETAENKTAGSAPAEKQDTPTPKPKDGEQPRDKEVKEPKPGEKPDEDPEKKPKESKEASDKPDGDDDDQLPKGVKKRLGKITKKWRKSEKAANAETKKRETAEARTSELEKEIEALKETAASSNKPTADQFDTEDELTDAIADWKLAQKEKTQKIEAKKTQADEEQRKLNDLDDDRRVRFEKVFKESAKKHDDFDEVIEGIDIPMSTVSVFEKLKNPGDVAYYLGSNPDEADALLKMDAASAGAELQKISSKLKPNRVTNAPAPFKPVKSQGGGVKAPEDMDMAEYNAMRNKQDKEKRDAGLL